MDPTIKPKIARCAEDLATTVEAVHAVRNLTQADYAKLMIIARFFFRERLQNMNVQAEDLLHEAITKTVDGRRQWNKKVSIIRHLDRVMESDSGHILGHATTFIKESIPQDGCDEPELFSDPRNRLDARLDVCSVLGLFDGDPTATELLKLRAQGYEASDIQEKMEIDKSKYETTMKRIRRRLLPFIATEGKNYETKGDKPINDESSSP